MTGHGDEEVKALRRELRAEHRVLVQGGKWTEDWDAYQELPFWHSDGRALTRDTHAVRRNHHNVFDECVCTFVRTTLGWYEGSRPSRIGGRISSPGRSWIRYYANSGDLCARPTRVALARTLERLYWLAEMDPPTWDRVRNRETCLAAIEEFKACRREFRMANGALFLPSDWRWNQRPECHQCRRADRTCG